LSLEESEHLHGFAKAHFICQDPTKARLRKCGKPSESMDLIGPKSLLQFLRNIKIGILDRPERTDQTFEVPVPRVPASSGLYWNN
jgi:hypothetical protein